MKKANLSYAEAYTEFLKYCAIKENTNINILIARFRNNGVEKDFRLMYDGGKQISNAEYYKRARGI